MENLIPIVATGFIAARATHLVTKDVLTSRARSWVERLGPRWAIFVTCPWCIGLWITLIVFAGVYAITGQPWTDTTTLIIWAGAAAATNLATATASNLADHTTELKDQATVTLYAHANAEILRAGGRDV